MERKIKIIQNKGFYEDRTPIVCYGFNEDLVFPSKSNISYSLGVIGPIIRACMDPYSTSVADAQKTFLGGVYPAAGPKKTPKSFAGRQEVGGGNISSSDSA